MPARTSSARSPVKTAGRRPGPAPTSPRTASEGDTRALVFSAAAHAFSKSGYDGVGVDDIAAAAGVNKAMLYYHFENKLGLYRAVVRDMLEAVRTAVMAIAGSAGQPAAKIERFVEVLAELRATRPWFPPLMMREMVAGAPNLDPDTLAVMRGVFAAFVTILDDGVSARAFRRVNPVLAYLTIMGPLMMNAVRERAGATPGRAHLPMFVPLDRHEVVAHVQDTALRMLAKDRSR